jgi:hypothetical protein
MSDARTRSIVRAGVLVAVVLIVAQSLSDLLNLWLADLTVRAFDIDANNSVFDVISTVAIGAAALAATALAWRDAAHRIESAALAALLVVAAVADGLQLGGNVVRDGSTKILYLTLLAGVALAWWVARIGPPLARRAVRVGIVCLVLSIVVDTVFHELNEPLHLWLRRGDAGHEVFTLVKQGLELGGWVLVATGLYAVAAARWRSSEASAIVSSSAAT